MVKRPVSQRSIASRDLVAAAVSRGEPLAGIGDLEACARNQLVEHEGHSIRSKPGASTHTPRHRLHFLGRHEKDITDRARLDPDGVPPKARCWAKQPSLIFLAQRRP